MPNWREPHWTEGMLLLPHHLQSSQRYWDTMLGVVWQTSAPFSWGFDELVLSDAQIREGVVGIERCRLRTPEGTWVVVPDNTEVAARPLDDALTESPDGLMVYLAVPKLHEIHANARYEIASGGQPTRYLVEPTERRDENSGDNVQRVDTHSMQGRLLFGDEVNRPGFESIPLVRLYLSGEEGGVTRRDVAHVPPLMQVGASSELHRMIKDVVHEAGARNRELAAEAKKGEMSFGSGVDGHTERLMMLHVLNQALAWLRQMVAVPEVRPFVAYAELCRFAGQLSVFSGDRSVMEYPLYDHFNIGKNFATVCDHLGVLFKSMSREVVKWRDFEAREEGEGLQVTLEEDWLSRRRELYVGVHCGTMDDSELDALLQRMRWKIGALEDVDTLFRAGLPGLNLRRVRAATGLLPSNPEIKYYQIMHDDEQWPKVEAGRVLAIRYSPDAQEKLEGIRFKIYVVLSKQADA